MDKCKCIVCDKEMKIDEYGPYGGGCCLISFHFGSQYDWDFHSSGLDSGNLSSALDKLLACDKIEAFICDECFKEKAHLCRGFMVTQKVSEKRIL